MQRPTLHDWAVLHDWDRNSIDNLISSIECHSERIGNLKQSIWEYKTFPERHTLLEKCLDRQIEHLEKLLEQEKNFLARSKNDLSVHLIWLFNRVKKGDYTPDINRWIHMKRIPTNSGAN